MINVRPAGLNEAETLHALTAAAYEEYRATPTPSSALAETAREVRDGLWSGSFRAAIAEFAEGGAPAGAVRYRIDSGGLYFFRLSVPPEHRRKGVARALVSWLEEEAARNRAGRIWCQVRLIVPGNVALYTGLGFEISERHVVMRNGLEVPTGTMEKIVRSGS